jgi:uncharacterized protein
LYPRDYIKFLVHFHADRDYFECHEILEEYWKTETEGHKDSIWVGFILLAVSTYHHRRSNFAGAKRTLEKALRIFSQHDNEISKFGLDKVSLFPLLHELLAAIEKQKPYQSFNLPINDSILLEQCKAECGTLGFVWGKESEISDKELVNRHSLRDRTPVIQDRLNAINKKRGSE